jgi:hypothetical protein
MTLATVLERLADSLLLNLPALGVWVWALIRTRRLGPSSSRWHRQIGLAMVVLVALTFTLPIVQLVLFRWLPPSPDRSALYSVAMSALGLAGNAVYALCWFVVLRAALTGASDPANVSEKGLTS